MSVVWLQAVPGQEPVGFFQSPMFLVTILMLIWVYFLIIRPQQKQKRDHDNLVNSIEKGDGVVTTGGLHGKVTGITDDVLTLEISQVNGQRVRIKQSRQRIDSVQKAKKGEKGEAA